MLIRPLTVVVPLALSLGLVACDSRDYEAEITDLQTQLEQAQNELEAQRTENQTLTGEMDELRAQAEQAPGAAMAGGEVPEGVRDQLTTAHEKASLTAERLAALERDPDAPPEARTEAVNVLRTDVEDVVAAIESAASELGMELEAGPAPAAGPAEEPAAGAATGGGQEAGQAQPAPEQPADQPQQQQ
jgi:multidrug resistance efflux pump